MKSRVKAAWIMAEIKPYSFESMRNSSESEEDDVHMYARVVRSRTEKGNKRKIVYDARRSIEEAVNTISGEFYFCIQQMLIILVLGR